MPHKTIIRLSGVARNPANGFPARLLAHKAKVCEVDDCQGNRVLTKEHLEQVILNPAGFQPYTLKSPFQAGLLLQQIEGYLAQDCQVLGTMVLSDPAVIFSKGNIQRPVQAVFDAPMSAGSLQ